MKNSVAKQALWGILCLIAALNAEFEAKIKDVAFLKGIQKNRLYGYGLVVGLAGTGDGRSELAKKTLSQFLNSAGVEAKEATLEGANTAVVAVSADMTGFLNKGETLDIQVASIGSAKSIENGMLLQTVLKGPDGQIWAVAGGIVGNGTGAEKSPRRGLIGGGATMVKEIAKEVSPFKENQPLTLVLKNPSLTLAVAIKEAVEGANPDVSLSIVDDRLMTLSSKNPSAMTWKAISELLNLAISVDGAATVVIDRQTGVVVGGQSIRVDTSFISLPGLRVAVKPGAVSPISGVLKANTTVNDLATEFNNLGIKPSEMIAIFYALKKAGAMNAEVIVQ